MELRTNGPVLPVTPRAVDKPLAAAPASPAAPTGTTQGSDTTRAVRPSAGPQPGAALDDAVRQINESLKARSQEIEFSVDKDSNRTIVKVVDTTTKEVLRQMPSEETLEIAKALDRVQWHLIRQKA